MIKFLANLLLVIFSKVLADDIKEWVPKITGHLIERAVKRLPDGSRDRYQEEWSRHIDDTPGVLAKVIESFRLGFAARRMARIASQNAERVYEQVKRIIDVLFSLVAVVWVAPAGFILCLLLLINQGRPVFEKQRVIGFREREFAMFRFRANGRWKEWLDRLGFRTFPAVVNVLRGDLSLFGPKAYPPKLHSAASTLIPRWKERTTVKPGLFQLITCEFEGGLVAVLQRELQDDLYYIQNRSLQLDLNIMIAGLGGHFLREL